RQLPDAEPRVQKALIVAELVIIEPDGARDDVLELRQGNEALAPGARDLARRDAPQPGVVRHHEVARDAGPEVPQAKLLEVPRLGGALREIRLHEAEHALVGDRGRQAERVRLERVARVDAVRVDDAAARDLAA